MKICMMTNTYVPHVGGVARSVDSFTRQFRAEGHEVLVVAPSFPEAGAGESALEPGVVRLPAIQQFNGSDFSVRLPVAGIVNETIDAFEANIVHSHHPFLIGDTAMRIAARKHVPIIFTHHTRYEEYTHYMPFDSAALKQFTLELCTRYANLCDGIVAPSQSIADLLRERGVESPVEVVPTGIDVESFANGNGRAFRIAHKIPADAFVVGHIGRLAPEKNLPYLAEAVAAFLRKTPGAYFVLVGSGPAAETIQASFTEWNLADRLVMPGTKSGGALADAYCAFDIFAFSSLSETQGLVLAEAMAAGAPVVALDACGVREVVRDGCNGFLLPADSSPDALAGRLGGLARDRAQREKFSAAARVTAGEFSLAASAAKALAFYEHIRQATRPRRQAEREDSWTAFLKRMDVEWSLIAEKTKAAVHALAVEDEVAENSA